MNIYSKQLIEYLKQQHNNIFKCFMCEEAVESKQLSTYDDIINKTELIDNMVKQLKKSLFASNKTNTCVMDLKQVDFKKVIEDVKGSKTI